MKKLFKNRVFIIVTVMVIIIALLVVGIFAVNGAFSSVVDVYKVSDMSLDWWGAGTTATGKITAGELQSVKLNSEKEVSEVYVKKGDKVKKGDRLFDYDLTQVKSDIRSCEVEVESAENAVYIAQAELKAMESATPNSVSSSQPNDAYLNTTVDVDMIPYAGDGSKTNPYRFNLASGAMLGSDYINALKGERENDLYQLLEYHAGNDIQGDLLYEVRLVFYDEGTFDFSVAQFDLGSDRISTDYSKYSKEDLEEMIENKADQIKTLKVDKSIAEAKLSAQKSKLENSTVYAAYSGTVTALRDAKTSVQDGKPFIEILGKKGFYVNGAVNEFELANAKVGSKVDIINSANKAVGTAVITNVSEYPDSSTAQERETALSVANTNASYYPFTAKVSVDASVKQGESVSVSFEKENISSVYILSAFVVQEDGGRSFVYVNDGGVLKKQYVDIGTIVYGEYSQITDGLDKNSELAFPYGKSVKSGAKTKLGSLTDLLSSAS